MTAVVEFLENLRPQRRLPAKPAYAEHDGKEYP
jgi:hypothetical protein